MPANTLLHRYFDAFNGSYDALIDAIQSGAERGYRLSSIVLAEVQHGQHETLELGQSLAAEPTNVRGMYRRVRETAERGRARRRELRRQVVDELAQSRTEARETFDRMAMQQRRAEDATVQLARDAFDRFVDGAQVRLQRTLEQAESRRSSEVAAQLSRGAHRDAVGSVPVAEAAPEWMTSSEETQARSDAAPPSGKPRRTPPADAVRGSVG